LQGNKPSGLFRVLRDENFGHEEHRELEGKTDFEMDGLKFDSTWLFSLKLLLFSARFQ
jgi:hypothetical protein